MRTLNLFLRYTITIILIVGVLSVVLPFIMLQIAASNIIKATEGFENIGAIQFTYNKQCKAAPSASPLSAPVALQLRFIDEKTYVIEVICSFIENTPVVITRGTLPRLVTKDPGSSGIYVDGKNPESASFSLRSFFQTKNISFDGKSVSSTALPNATQSTLPITVCTGYGYQCCDGATQKGEGKTASASDCQSSCFAVCKNLPYVLSFSADPYPVNQEIRMDSDTVDVSFSYAADLSGGKIARVIIDYGDGTLDVSTESTGIFNHTFICPSVCTIPVTIKAEDATGLSSVANESATLYIKRE